MTYKGVYRDGTIVPGTSLDLADGTRVSFTLRPERPPSSTSKKQSGSKPRKKTPVRMTPEQRVAAFMKGFGISRDVPEWKGRSTQAIARELRQAALGQWGSRRKPRRA